MKKKTAVVICPGRGTYNKAELGYLHKYHADFGNLIQEMDQYRSKIQLPSIWELDGREHFSLKEHLRGVNSSGLIFASTYSDFLKINQQEYEIVAITGNSMGWYSACVCAGALSFSAGVHLIHTMSMQMNDEIIGGQIIYPEINEDWTVNHEISKLIDEKLKKVNSLAGHEVYNSIFFGGYRILGGNEAGVKSLLDELPPYLERYPFRLVGNGAFHTPLFSNTSKKVKQELEVGLFQNFQIPLIDGRGKIWSPYSSNLNELWDYTLGHQVECVYDFTTAVTVAVKEFAPDHLIIPGPGMNLGGAVAQVLINKKLKSFTNKQEFKTSQMKERYLLSMADHEQRSKIG